MFPAKESDGEEYELRPGTHRLDEEISYRVDALKTLGVSEALAEMVAPTELDWHFVEALVARGCEPNTAVRVAL